MLRRLLLLALCVFPAIAIECDKCTGKDCSEICYLRQKVRSTEAKYKCCSADSGSGSGSGSGSDSGSGPDGVDQCFTDDKGCDGSAAGVDQCFLDGGGCASCCGACTITTDLDNQATTETCVCYEASTAPSDKFYGTEKNDCVFIKANYVRFIQVRNQCLEEARRKCSLRRGEEVDARDASRACGRDSDLPDVSGRC